MILPPLEWTHITAEVKHVGGVHASAHPETPFGSQQAARACRQHRFGGDKAACAAQKRAQTRQPHAHGRPCRRFGRSPLRCPLTPCPYAPTCLLASTLPGCNMHPRICLHFRGAAARTRSPAAERAAPLCARHRFTTYTLGHRTDDARRAG